MEAFAEFSRLTHDFAWKSIQDIENNCSTQVH